MIFNKQKGDQMKNINLWLLMIGAICISQSSLRAEEEEDFEGALDEVVEFHIPNGTGNKPWNTLATTVKVKVGQTLRIINDDSVVHRLHTFNNKPCEHQDGESKTGEFYDCVISKTADPRIDLLYDHNFGEKSRFYLQAVH